MIFITESNQDGKGLSVFAKQKIPKGTQLYQQNRIYIKKKVLFELLQTNSTDACRCLRSLGWGEGELFVLPLGIEQFMRKLSQF